MFENCESAVIEIIEKALRLDAGIVNESSSSENMEDSWDSLGQLSILVAMDKYFDGRISSISEMAEANSVSKILNILKENSIC
jgi:acyl carrier protein